MVPSDWNAAIDAAMKVLEGLRQKRNAEAERLRAAGRSGLARGKGDEGSALFDGERAIAALKRPNQENSDDLPRTNDDWMW